MRAVPFGFTRVGWFGGIGIKSHKRQYNACMRAVDLQLFSCVQIQGFLLIILLLPRVQIITMTVSFNMLVN
jgi:hypothetical protein